MSAKELSVLLKKEIALELRNKVAISGILLYVISTVFVCYLSFRRLDDPLVWNTLFWVILLFSAVNTISKSFHTETRNRLLYLYTLSSPAAVILSKMLYNILLMGLTSLVTLLVYSTLLGSVPLEGSNVGMYIVALLLGCSGFSGIFTMIAAISARTGNNLGIMAILGFPLILPLLVTLIELSGIALRGLTWEYGFTAISILAGINVLVVALSYLLFPYLWRE
ncbi:MAG: heme exporter protein CcmB [Flavobacteriales bacterium]|nr:heme exporter protein CcmB [Flavobacteriales bacterium]